MPLPRVRFTVRRMMVAVAVAACIFCLIERRRRFLIIVGRLRMPDARFLRHPGDADYVLRLARWHDELQAKYEFAAAHPWLPVAPDPPAPE